MNNLLDLRVYRFCFFLYTGRPFVRLGWNRIPKLVQSFGRGFLWVRGFGVVYMSDKPKTKRQQPT